MPNRLLAGLLFAATALASTSASALEPLNPLQIFVSKDTQSLVVYEGDTVLGASNVSTGKAGHTTPSGIFSILEKRRTHFSNLYDDAPMPFMQRLTWSGIALHESGHVPRYPASHGCVRMPRQFAKSLFSATKRGYHVIISDREVVPQKMPAGSLLVPRYGKPPADLMSDAEIRPTLPADQEPVEVAMVEALPKLGAVAVATLPKDVAPVRILITRESEANKRRAIEALLSEFGYTPGDIDGKITKETIEAIKAFQTDAGQTATGKLTNEFRTALYAKANRPEPTGRLYVRRKFAPVFDAPVDLAEPEKALGTHFYNALNVNAAQNSVDWFGVSLDNRLGAKVMARLGITEPADATAPDAALVAFARVTMPSDLREKLETMLGNGSSMTITDTGTERETGKGTDFITITH